MKIQRINQFQPQIPFYFLENNFDQFKLRFLQSDLGKIYKAIPWNKLVKSFKLRDARKGPKSFFSPKGKIALMFLKHYAGVSDRKLIEHLNGNIEWQFFCDIYLQDNRLENYKIVSEIRSELAAKLDIDKLQQTLMYYWTNHIQNKAHITIDATCYESEVRYPTNQKLLWESVDWVYHQSRLIHKHLKIKHPRTKYTKWKSRYISYSKMRKKTKKKRVPLTRALLHLLNKLNGILDDVEKNFQLEMPAKYYKRRATIKKIYNQQYQLFTTGTLPKDRIVSISKNYLRPIVRGKEIKPVEFGAKVNKIQIDGINFIEHISFNNFNEGTRLINTVYYVQSLTKTKTKVLGADGIYATNKNRNFITKNQIQTDFKPKGKQGKHYKQKKKFRNIITKERASRLEGSFGKEKEHYHLKKVKAKTSKTEILWIFFGIHTANALEIGR